MKRLAPYALGGALIGTVGGVALGLDLWWLVWAAWAAYFAVAEGIALFRSRSGDTLSEHVWALFAINLPGRPHREVTGAVRLRRFLLLAGLAWLVAHFLTGGLF